MAVLVSTMITNFPIISRYYFTFRILNYHLKWHRSREIYKLCHDLCILVVWKMNLNCISYCQDDVKKTRRYLTRTDDGKNSIMKRYFKIALWQARTQKDLMGILDEAYMAAKDLRDDTYWALKKGLVSITFKLNHWRRLGVDRMQRVY